MECCCQCRLSTTLQCWEREIDLITSYEIHYSMSYFDFYYPLYQRFQSPSISWQLFLMNRTLKQTEFLCFSSQTLFYRSQMKWFTLTNIPKQVKSIPLNVQATIKLTDHYKCSKSQLAVIFTMCVVSLFSSRLIVQLACLTCVAVPIMTFIICK